MYYGGAAVLYRSQETLYNIVIFLWVRLTMQVRISRHIILKNYGTLRGHLLSRAHDIYVVCTTTFRISHEPLVETPVLIKHGTNSIKLKSMCFSSKT